MLYLRLRSCSLLLRRIEPNVTNPHRITKANWSPQYTKPHSLTPSMDFMLELPRLKLMKISTEMRAMQINCFAHCPWPYSLSASCFNFISSASYSSECPNSKVFPLISISVTCDGDCSSSVCTNWEALLDLVDLLISCRSLPSYFWDTLTSVTPTS